MTNVGAVDVFGALPSGYRRKGPKPDATAVLIEELSTLRDDQRDFAPRVAMLISDAHSVKFASVLGLTSAAPGRATTNFVGVAGPHRERLLKLALSFYEDVPESALSFGVREVPSTERARALGLRELFSSWADVHELPSWIHLLEPGGLGDEDHLRILVCDGPCMLGNIGMWNDEPFDAFDRTRLQALAPPLQKYLRRKLLLDEAGWTRAGMEAAMAALPSPALLVDARGRLLHANALAKSLWVERPDALDFLRDLGRQLPPPGFDVIPVRAHGVPPTFLVMQRLAEGTRGADCVRRFALDHMLTSRQKEVLTLVVEGQSNRAIADHLRCSIRTVELHVSAILRKADVERRAELVAEILGKP
jgi:DNA-binding CsgD family transcriptional regulator